MKRSTRGFSLIEVLVASVMAGVALAGVSWALSGATSSKADIEAEPLVATRIAQDIQSLAQTLSRQPSGIPGVTTGADVVALDSLIGAEFCPPIRADKSADESLGAWTQQVTLVLYSLDDLATPLEDDPGIALPSLSNRIYQLRVTVLKDDVPVDTWQWWLAP